MSWCGDCPNIPSMTKVVKVVKAQIKYGLNIIMQRQYKLLDENPREIERKGERGRERERVRK
jgi:hypothetical protein